MTGSQVLAGVSVQIADLPGNLLGEEIGKTILIDRDAAGYGWFIDPTPQDDAEFTHLAADVLVAKPQTAAAGHADLLTAVMHEMGHVLGYEHDAGRPDEPHLAAGRPPHAGNVAAMGHVRPSTMCVAFGVLLWAAACVPGMAAEPAAQEIKPRVVRLEFPSGRWVSCLCNADPQRPQPQVRIAVIVIHGYGGSSTNNLPWIVQAARRSGKLAETLLLAPQFHSAADQPQPGEHYWSKGGWAAGDRSKDSQDADKRLSSFAVADRLFAELSDAKRFPNLRRIVLAGHSAGGQFVNRYVAVGRLGESGGPARAVECRFLIANPSSYLYLDGRRPVAGGDRFEVPAKKPPGYNMWRYGLENRIAYADGMTADQIRQNVFTRRAYYLIGGEDNRPDENLARGPAAMAEGENRLDRWRKFRRYVALFPEWQAHAVFAEVPGVGHSGRQMFNSQAARAAMFER